MDEFYALCKEVYEKTGVKTDIAYGIAQSWSEYFMRSYDIVPFGDKCMNGDETSWTPFFEMYTTGLSEGWMLDPSVFAEITVGSVEQTLMYMARHQIPSPGVSSTTPTSYLQCRRQLQREPRSASPHGRLQILRNLLT